MIVLVKDKHYSDLWPLKGQEVSYFNKLHICSKNVNNVSLKPYLSPDTTSAPSNMSFLLWSCSIHNQKHYLQCYFEACSLSFLSFISIFQSVAINSEVSGIFFDRKYDLDSPKHRVFLHPSTRKTTGIDSKGQFTSAAWFVQAMGTSYSPILACGRRVRVKTRYFYKNSK
jgi:hypothetical protein